MLKYIGKKVLIAIATVFVLATATFFLMKLIPGDPFLNDKIPVAVQDKQRAFYGLDKPVPQQYLTYMNNLLHGDLGYSIKKTGKTVVDIIKEAFPVSAKLGLISLLFAEAVGLFFGILCAQFRGKWPDYLLMVVAVLGIALPSMVLGPILRMIFGVKLGILPVTGWGKPNQIILPALVLGLGTVAGNTRNMRASMLAITTQDYVKTARAKGLSPIRVVLKHQFKNSLAQFIKICATGGVSSAVDDFNDIEFSPEEIRVIVEEAARHNTYVTAHCTGTEGTKQAIKNGVKCIEHGVLLDEECVQMMAEKNIPLVTTLSVSLGLADMKGLPDFMTKKAKALGDASKHSFALAHQYGIRVALGTDYSNSPNTPFHEIGKEFYSLTRCGYTNMEAIKAGTINGAYLMKSDDKFGSLEAGKLADLVVVDGDPSEDIMLLANADHVRLVMIGGEIKKNTL